MRPSTPRMARAAGSGSHWSLRRSAEATSAAPSKVASMSGSGTSNIPGRGAKSTINPSLLAAYIQQASIATTRARRRILVLLGRAVVVIFSKANLLDFQGVGFGADGVVSNA